MVFYMSYRLISEFFSWWSLPNLDLLGGEPCAMLRTNHGSYADSGCG